jgi:hypothetical protein
LVIGKLLTSDLENIFFEIVHTNPGKPIGLEIWFDQHCLIDQPKLNQDLKFYHEFHNKPQAHHLEIVVKNKMPWHTVIDSDHQIVSDTALKIQNFRMNDILMIDSFFARAKYQSKELGTISLIERVGYLGFNGRVTFEFDSPVDDWAVNNYF